MGKTHHHVVQVTKNFSTNNPSCVGKTWRGRVEPTRSEARPGQLHCTGHLRLGGFPSTNVTRSSPANQPLYRTALSSSLTLSLSLSLSCFFLLLLPLSLLPMADSLSPPVNHPRTFPAREDCWTLEASSTLVDVWGRRYVQLNRGNLRQKDWQDVADAVNALHGHTKKTHRTDVQCKNRIDTIKKKYKLEKTRVSSSPNASPSTWPFFDRLDLLIGPSLTAKKASPSPSPLSLPYRKTPSPVPTTKALAMPSKRSAAAVLENGFFMRNYSAMAAAAAAAAESDEEEDEDEERGSEVEVEEEEKREKEGLKSLAKAIERFGEVYERMEREKLRQMVDLEKQRMQFTKDMEVQRMHIFMDTQVQLGRIKRGKRSGSNDMYS